MIVGNEICDDGNALDGDGCSKYCDYVEAGFVCGPSGSLCCKGILHFVFTEFLKKSKKFRMIWRIGATIA